MQHKNLFFIQLIQLVLLLRSSSTNAFSSRHLHRLPTRKKDLFGRLTPFHVVSAQSWKFTTTTALQAKKQNIGGKKQPQNKKNRANTKSDKDHELIKGLVKNLFSVCAHIQNPDLYAPTWADHATLQQQDTKAPKLVTSNHIKQGDILTLYPLDALGLRKTTSHQKGGGNTRKPLKTISKRPPKNTSVKDFVVFDHDKDGAYFQDQLSQSLTQARPLDYTDYRVNVPLMVIKQDQNDDNLQLPQAYDIFVDINANNLQHFQAGWMGHLASKQHQQQQQSSPDTTANCRVMPLPGAAPLCALVATSDLDPGIELIVDTPNVADKATQSDQTYADMIDAKYSKEIQELGAYLKMAYQAPLQPFDTTGGGPDATTNNDDDDDETYAEPTHADEATINFQFPFHTINLDYPGLRYLHRNPDILSIANFLSDEECDKITTHAKSHLISCVIKHPQTGAVQEDPSRTSTNANMPQFDAPSIVDKIVSLANCPDATHLETLQVLRYTKGQFFHPHTDGFQGPTTACGFEQSGRLATIFCYLNDVPEGGETRFPKLTVPNDNDNPSNETRVLSIAPRKGMAVVHFPATTGFEEDPRTEHEGSAAMDEKWLLVTWMWKHPRTDPQYAEHLFPSIMGATTNE